MKKVSKYILFSLLSLLGILMLLPTAIYIPAVQQWGKQQIIHRVKESTGMDLSVGGLSIGFPLRLQVNDILLLTAPQDTMLQSARVKVGIHPVALLGGNVDVREIKLEETLFRFSAADSSLHLIAHIKELATRHATVDLIERRITLPDTRLTDGDMILNLHESQPDTSVTESSMPDWKISIGNLSLSQIHYAMQMRPTIESLDATVGEATLQKGEIDLHRQTVHIAETIIDKGDYRYYPGSGETATESEASEIDHSSESLPWAILIEKLRLHRNEALYALPTRIPQKGLDPGYLSLNRIEIAIDSLYNRGSEIVLPIQQLAFIERSGIAVEHTHGRFVMDSTGIALHDFLLRTDLSEISAHLQAGNGIWEQAPNTPIDARLHAAIAVGDLIRILPDFVPYTRGLLLSTSLQSDIEVTGSLNKLSLNRGEINLPGTWEGEATGVIQDILDLDRATGKLQWEFLIKESPFVTHLLTDSTPGRIKIPPTLLEGKAQLANNTVSTRAHLTSGDGAINLAARLLLDEERYQGRISVEKFPLSQFLPLDSLGLLSAKVSLSGHGYNPLDSTMQATIRLSVDTADYAGYRYKGLSVETQLKERKLNGHIFCDDPHLNTDLTLSGTLSPERYTAQLNGNLTTDLEALHLATEICSLSTHIDLSSEVIPEAESYAADLQLTDFNAALPTAILRTNRLTLSAATDTTHIDATLQNGDLNVRFTSDLGLTDFIEKLNQSIPILTQVQTERRLDMSALHQTLPSFTLNTSAKRNNLAQQYLKGMDMSFAQFQFDLKSDSMLNAIGKVDRFSTSGITIDTVQLSAYERHEHEERLYYALRVGNKAGNLDQLASLILNGFLSGNTTKLYCVQKNRQGDTGFSIGCQADFLDSLVQVSFFPKNPIIGFESWTLNPDNFFAYHYGNHFDADISLINGEKHLIVKTLHEHERHDLAHQEALRVDMNGIEIAPWLSLSPFAPQIEGSISADLQVQFPTQATEMNGHVGIDNFYYGRQRVGDFNLNVDYRLDSLSRQRAHASLMVDSTRVLTLHGLLDNQAENPVMANLTIDQLPLSTINPFLPSGMIQLQGVLNGDMTVDGTLNAPRLDGFLQMSQASASSKNMGVKLHFPQDSLRIVQNRLRFNQYPITGANKNPLRIDGTIDFQDFSRIMAQLELKASEFQPVKAEKSSKATVYGSAITDINLTANGRLDALKIRGNVSLLTGTEVTYVMQDSPFALQRQENDMVTFISFNDSTELAIGPDTLPQTSLTGMDILVNVNISPTVKAGVNLSVDGKNRIDLQGGGDLTYTMNTLGDSRFSGRYNLSSGFVRYNPPIIAEKLFQIQDGSYVSWNGDIADPHMSITAVETVRTTISEENKNTRQVNFDISIIIQNTLENLSVAFDLAAPEDLTIQNQLTSLTAEQRASQAMSLLLYNTYTGPGTSTKNDLLSNPLNSFLEKELNQWAQENLKGVDLSFGIDSYTDASGVNTRTDYSYRAAKSLFNNRMKVVIGGSLSPDDNADVNFKENFIDDVSLEYYLNQRDNMYIKVFRHTGYESILEGEITQTGVGFVVKKRLLNLRELFRFRRERKEEKKP